MVDPTGVDQAGDAELVAWNDSPEPVVAPAMIGNPTGELASWHEHGAPGHLRGSQSGVRWRV